MSDHTIPSPTQPWPLQAGLRHAIRSIAARFWPEHAAVLLFFAVLSLAVSWPMLPNFTTRITGMGPDGLHNLWILWHTKQFFLGKQPLFFAPDLYYPHGISLLVHGLGPLTGIFALPFWILGPEAAYNGAVLVSLVLTGYAMYLLARGLGFTRGVALVAGALLLTSPMCLSGLFGHMTKVFLGGVPLALLSLHYALDLKRSLWWAGGVALALLLLLLHSGYQFVAGAIAVSFFTLILLQAAERSAFWSIFRRVVITALVSLVCVAPLLLAIVTASRDPDLAIQANYQSPPFDIATFGLPRYFHWLVGKRVTGIFRGLGEDPTTPDTAVALSWIGLLLCAAGLAWGERRLARRWVIFFLVCVLLALGPTLKAFEQQEFTDYHVPIVLPYAFLSSLPGLDFMRVSSRFLLVGIVGLSIGASYGLNWLTRRFPRHQHIIVATAIGLVLLEGWPRPFGQQKLPHVPDFYHQLANDTEQYGVFDLPLVPANSRFSYNIHSAPYQIFQMTHHKGIAAGHLSRTFGKHPLFSFLMSPNVAPEVPQFRINDSPTNVYVDARELLARNNYRYVVWHKNLYREPSGEETFLQAVFGSQLPLLDTNEVRVYAVTPVSSTQESTLAMGLDSSWYAPNEDWWWTQSPTHLFIHSPVEQLAALQLQPAILHDPQSPYGTGARGRLVVQTEDTQPFSVTFAAGLTTTIPLRLIAGTQSVTLSLATGNFRPTHYGVPDSRLLSFAIQQVNLQTFEHITPPADITINGQPQQPGRDHILATHGFGWYDFEPPMGARWAAAPATLYIYSPTAQQVQLRLFTWGVHVIGSAQGMGLRGNLFISVNNRPPQQVGIQVKQISTPTVNLRAGWNTVTLVLEAGTFRPSTLVPGSPDERDLAVALRYIDIVTP